MSNRQDFILTADASQVHKVSKQIEEMMDRILKSCDRVAVQANKLGGATGGMKRLQREALNTVNEFMHMAAAAESSARRIQMAFGRVSLQGMAGGMSGAGGSVTPSQLRPFHPGQNPSGVMPFSRPHAAARYRSLENVPLFGGFTGLEQGQQIQNAMMGLLPLAVMGGVWGKGVSSAIDQRRSNAMLSRVAGNAGVTGSGGTPDMNDLLARLIMGGETSMGRAKRQAGLAMDLEAAGGNAKAFVEAMAKSGPEAAKAVQDIAREMGLSVDVNETLNETLRNLADKFGGLSAEVERAGGSWPRFFKEIETNLGIFGNLLADFSGLDRLTALVAGDPDKAEFLRNAGKFGNPDKLAMSAGVYGVVGMEDHVINKMTTQSPDAMVNKAMESLLSARRSGKLSRERHHDLMSKVHQANRSGDYNALYDMANNPVPTNEVDGGSKGDAVAEEKTKTKASKRVTGPRTGSSGEVRVVLSVNPHSPSPMTARGF